MMRVIGIVVTLTVLLVGIHAQQVVVEAPVGAAAAYASMVMEGTSMYYANERFTAFRDSSIVNTRETYEYIIVWNAHIFASDGYGEEARSFVRALYAHGLPIMVVANDQRRTADVLPPEEAAFFNHLIVTPDELVAKKGNKIIVGINHVIPALVKALPYADITVARTMWETVPFPQNFLGPLATVHDVWTPSDFNKKTIVEAGYDRSKVYVVGECGDDHYINYDKKKSLRVEGSRKFNFLSMFNWNYRKGWDVLVRAFMEEFSPREDVALFLKTYSIWNTTIDQMRQQIKNYIVENNLGTDLPPNLHFLSQAFKTSEMPILYASFDAFVLATRAEGWGRGSMEAMLVGTPVITTKCSGQAEFINKKTAWPVPYELVDVPEHGYKEFPLFKGSKWAEPDLATLKKHMRTVYEKPKEARKKAEGAKKWLIDHFGQDKIAARVKERVETLVSAYKNSKH